LDADGNIPVEKEVDESPYGSEDEEVEEEDNEDDVSVN